MVGYRVSVGTSPGVYSETFDVGTSTAFVYYTNDSRLRYLAVASYAAGPRLGPLSAPISAVPVDPPGSGGGSSAPDAITFYAGLWRDIASGSSVGDSVRATATARLGGSFRGTAAITPPSVVCWTASSECLSVRTLVRRNAEITSLAASADGRLFFLEDSQRIGLLTSGVLQSQAVLVADSASVQLTQLNLDPAFAVTGVIYVGERESQADGTGEFRVARYRVVRNRARERAVVISVPLPFSGHTRFSVSSAGQVDLMMSSSGDSLPSPYAGMVLRVDVDGIIPSDQPGGSPVIATGYANPTAIAFDEHEQRLWLAGVDERNQASVASVGGPVSPTSVAVLSLSTSTDATGQSVLFLASAAGVLSKGQIGPGGVITDSGQLMLGNGRVQAVVAAPSGDLYVAVLNDNSIGGTTSILRLTPAR